MPTKVHLHLEVARNNLDIEKTSMKMYLLIMSYDEETKYQSSQVRLTK